MKREFRTIDLERTSTDTENFYLFNLILIIKKKTFNYVSKGRNLKQSKSVNLLFGLIPVYGTTNLINKV